MTRFEVWAPNAESVSLRIGGSDTPMVAGDSGYWWSDAETAAGTRYSYVIGDHAYADPRSNWQPEGIHGPSATVDHSSFEWTDRLWHAPPLKSAIIYELHIGTFTPAGTFLSTIEQLDHLADLGITHIEIMPVNQASGEYGWGYDGVNLFAPQHSYGSPDDLKRLVNTCHAKGLAVILDVVYNHLGPVGNSLERFGPYFTRHYTTPWGPAINLDQEGCEHVRRFICDNAKMWLRDYHFDGLRLDAVHAFVDHSAWHFLEQLSDEIAALEAHLGRNLALIAESDLNDPRAVRDPAVGGYGITAQWSDDLHHGLHAVLTGEISGYYQDFGKISHIAKALKEAWVYDGRFSPYRKRPHGRPATGLRGWSFVVCAQNHDQVGNRATGNRLSQLVSAGKATIAAALVLTSPFLPMIFQGEEWGASSPFLYFTNHQEDWMAQAVSEGRRREFSAFGWRAEEIPDPQSYQTFASSKLCWSELGEGDHADLLSWYKNLIRLRRERMELTDGNLDEVQVTFNEEERWLSMRRGRLAAAYNFAPDERTVAFPSSVRVLLSSRKPAIRGKSLILPPESVTILESE